MNYYWPSCPISSASSAAHCLHHCANCWPCDHDALARKVTQECETCIPVIPVSLFFPSNVTDFLRKVLSNFLAATHCAPVWPHADKMVAKDRHLCKYVHCSIAWKIWTQCPTVYTPQNYRWQNRKVWCLCRRFLKVGLPRRNEECLSRREMDTKGGGGLWVPPGRYNSQIMLEWSQGRGGPGHAHPWIVGHEHVNSSVQGSYIFASYWLKKLVKIIGKFQKLTIQ